MALQEHNRRLITENEVLKDAAKPKPKPKKAGWRMSYAVKAWLCGIAVAMAIISSMIWAVYTDSMDSNEQAATVSCYSIAPMKNGHIWDEFLVLSEKRKGRNKWWVRETSKTFVNGYQEGKAFLNQWGLKECQ